MYTNRPRNTKHLAATLKYLATIVNKEKRLKTIEKQPTSIWLVSIYRSY